MKIETLRAVLHLLNHTDVRYLIAGGVAVNIHGYQRMTRDLDIFVDEPFDFDMEYQKATGVDLDRDLHVKVVSIPTLIEMKKQAGRDRDKDDIQHLQWILEETGGNER